jgi:hypothetical protein
VLPSEFSVLSLLLSPSLHFDTSVALAWIIWLESWVHRRLIRTYVCSFQTAHLYVIWCSAFLSFAEIDPIDLYLIWSTRLLSVAETDSSDLNYAKLCPSVFNGPLVSQLPVCNWCFLYIFLVIFTRSYCWSLEQMKFYGLDSNVAAVESILCKKSYTFSIFGLALRHCRISCAKSVY